MGYVQQAQAGAPEAPVLTAQPQPQHRNQQLEPLRSATTGTAASNPFRDGFAFGDGLEGHDQLTPSALIPCAAKGFDRGGQPARRPKPTRTIFLIMTSFDREAAP